MKKELKYIIFLVSLVLSITNAYSSTKAVEHWSELIFKLSSKKSLDPPQAANIMASVSVSMFEAVNGILRKYPKKYSVLEAGGDISAHAAINGAGRASLLYYFPEFSKEINVLFTSEMAEIPDNSAKENGRKYGENIAIIIITLPQAHVPSRFGEDAWVSNVHPGKYSLTVNPVGASWLNRTLWGLESALYFRPSEPPSLNSEKFRVDLNEVEMVGENLSTIRTSEQTHAAIFWQMNGVEVWNKVLFQNQGYLTSSIVDSLRAYSVLNMAISDGYASAWASKYHYSFWRPWSAINFRLAENKNRTSWNSLINTPMHPEYPSGHSVNAGVAVVLISHFFPQSASNEITIKSDSDEIGLRRFGSINELKAEISNSRIWGGVHFRFSCEEGVILGQKIGEYFINKMN